MLVIVPSNFCVHASMSLEVLVFHHPAQTFMAQTCDAHTYTLCTRTRACPRTITPTLDLQICWALFRASAFATQMTMWMDDDTFVDMCKLEDGTMVQVELELLEVFHTVLLYICDVYIYIVYICSLYSYHYAFTACNHAPHSTCYVVLRTGTLRTSDA